MTLFISALACGFPSLPGPPLDEEDLVVMPDVVIVDEDTQLHELLACRPGTSTCLNASTELVCTEDGQRELQEPCGPGMACRFGSCSPPKEVCQQGSYGLELSASQVQFDVDVNGKSEGQTVLLANCGKDPVALSSVKWSTPYHQDGSPVFTFDQRQPLRGGMEIGPGKQVPFTLLFHPRDGARGLQQDAWQERGELSLSVVDGATRTTHRVEMQTSSWCLTSPPQLDLGTFPIGVPQDLEIPIRNCGTHPVWMTVGVPLNTMNASLAFEPLVNAKGRQSYLQASLEPGEEIVLRGQATLEEAQVWQQNMVIGVIPQQAHHFSGFTNTQILGAALLQDTCVEERPALLLNGQPQSDLDIHESFELAQIELPVNSPWTVHYEVIESPDAFGSHLALSDTKQFLMWPRSVGEYRVRATLFDPHGVIACERPEFTLRVHPPAHWRVELFWDVEDDSIALDEGPGRGMDVDLHLRYLDAGVQGWHEPSSSCWGGRGDCAQGRASLLHVSDSGASPESIVWQMAPGERVEIMAHLKNTGPFSVGRLHARIWHEGMLIKELSESLDASGESWCIAWGDASELGSEQVGGRYSRMPSGCAR